jgi:hypothetical protein
LNPGSWISLGKLSTTQALLFSFFPETGSYRLCLGWPSTHYPPFNSSGIEIVQLTGFFYVAFSQGLLCCPVCQHTTLFIYIYTISLHLFTHELMNIWVISPFWLLGIIPLWLSIYRYFCEYVFWFLLMLCSWEWSFESVVMLSFLGPASILQKYYTILYSHQ